MFYKVTAFPDSKVEEIELKNDRYRIFVREPASDNRANKAIVRALANQIGVLEKELRIIKGHTSMSKIIEKISPI